MTVSIGSSTKLNSIAGVSQVLQLTNSEKISLANKILPPNILVRDDAGVLYMTDGINPVSALEPIEALASYDSSGNNIVNTYATKSELGDKADSVDLTNHTGNTDIHVTANDKSNWNAKQDALTIETVLNKNSTNLLTNGATTAALEGKLDATGVAASATKLETSRNINGTAFNGTSAITTAKWGTSRTITVTDSTSTHSTTTSTDGSANFTLTLPGTIAADVTGNAATATTASDYAAGGTIESALGDKALASDLNTHTGDTVAHCTQAEKNAWNAKQAALSSDQLAAVNSGITSAKVGVYDGYASQIAAKANTADVDDMISTAISEINTVEMVTAASLASLPAQGKVGTFYLVRNTASSGNNLYTEYIWTGTEYEETGANVDLKDYVTNSTLTTELGKKQNSLTTLQQDAVNSGINATKVNKYDGYESTINGITSANNSTITIKKNGTSVGSFTTNASAPAEVDISVPTKVSDLTNDSGFISAHPTVSTVTDTTSTASPAHGGSFDVVDGVTRDSFGHVTKINVKTVTLPADNNTDTLVNQNVSSANNTYPILLTPTANATTNQGAKAAIFASGVKVNPSTNTISATFSGNLTGNVTGNVSGSSGSCSGNAATATQFSSNAAVTLTGDVTGTVSSKKGWSVATTLADSGVTQGTYGPSADVNGSNGSTISVPEITVDAKGRITAIVNRTYTSVNTDTNTDTKVTQNVSSTDASYPILLTPTANAATNQGAKTAIFAAGVKVNPSSGTIAATAFSGPLTGDVTGNCSGTAANVTGTVAIGNGGTGATTRTNAFKNLTNESVGESAQFFITITSNWAKAGYTTVAQAKKVLGIDGVANVDASKAIVGITRSGTTFTYTCVDGTTGTFTQQDNNTWTAFKGATSSANGTAGYVPAPTKGNQDKFFKADGTWATPTNTTYSVATQSADGLLSSTDKTKLDSIAEGANNYTLPTASSTLGGVKTTSTVTSTSGLTACPIISGVPYYKDTNTTYSAMSAAEATTGTATTARSITAKVLHDKINSMIPDNVTAITSAEIAELVSQKLSPTPTRDGAMWMDSNYTMFVNEYNRG